jgi:CRISPR-associated DxTHG motif protein
MNSEKAVITILGLIGGNENHQKATYYFEDKKEEKKEYFNTFPLLIEKFSNDYKIVPLHTKEAKSVNEKVLQRSDITFANFEEKYFIDDDKNFTKLFNIINSAIEEYDELIIDVSHGFRHLPILMVVDLIIQNFQDTSKIKQIFFAKEIVQYKEYEIIDLKEYLDLANISFVLTTFEKNYTVASHIKSEKYKKLLKELNDFSNDLMALNIGNLKKTANELIIELDKIEEISIEKQALKLKETVQQLSNFENNDLYFYYYQLSKTLFEKNYILLSLTLLYESTVLFILFSIEKKNNEIYKKLENHFKNKFNETYIYQLGDLLKNLHRNFVDNNKINRNLLNEKEYLLLQNSYKSLNIQKLSKDINDKRNNLAHANSIKSFQDISQEVSKLIFQYESQIINKK